jgi:dihydroneopterin aldolase
MHKIMLHGMKFTGYHGVHPDEQTRAQSFVVDVEVEGDFTEAAARDDLTLTVDYRELYEIVKRIVEEERFHLLEALSEAIAASILQLPRVDTVTVRVKKPDVQLGGPLDYEAVEITRQRRD